MNTLPLDFNELAKDYQSALAVVAMVDRLDTTDLDFLPGEINTRRDWIEAIYCNRNHLEIILGRYEWPETYDLQPFRDAIAQADAKLTAMKMESKP